MFETQEERLLRLEIKYYNKLIEEFIRNKESNKEDDKEATSTPSEENIENLEELRKEAIVNFRRLKFRLEKRYKDISADQFLFPEHEAMGK